MTRDHVVAFVEREIKKAGSLRALARKWSITPAYLSDVRLGRRSPGPAICTPLGIHVEREVIVTYSYRPRR